MRAPLEDRSRHDLLYVSELGLRLLDDGDETLSDELFVDLGSCQAFELVPVLVEGGVNAVGAVAGLDAGLFGALQDGDGTGSAGVVGGEQELEELGAAGEGREGLGVERREDKEPEGV